MDAEKYDAIFDFLSCSESNRKWPDYVLDSKTDKIKDEKRNFRKICGKYEINDAILFKTHKKHGRIRVIRGDDKFKVLEWMVSWRRSRYWY